MPEDATPQELAERLNIIEKMIAEGRRHTESWGWTFILWGIAYYVALAWTAWRHSEWAWPATVLIAVVITIVVAYSKNARHPGTTLGRAIGSIWIALGISISLLFLALGFSGRLTDQHVFVAVIAGILGMANGASALILRWKVQFACAAVWWLAIIATSFGSDRVSTISFLAAIFLGQIAFGAYGLIAETKERNRRNPIHG